MTDANTIAQRVTQQLRAQFDITLPEQLVVRLLESSGVAAEREPRPSLEHLAETYGDEVAAHMPRWKDSGGKFAAAIVIGVAVGLGLGYWLA